MKTVIARYCLAALIVAFVSLLASLFSGCSSFGRVANSPAETIEAATTKVALPLADGRELSVEFPKELDATGLELVVDLKNQTATLKAKRIKSSSQALVESVSSAQAEALAEQAEANGKLADAFTQTLGLLKPTP